MFAKLITSAGNFVIPFLTLFLTQKQHYPEHMVGLFLTITTLGSVIGALLGGVISDRIERKQSILLSSTCAALSFCLVPLCMGSTLTLLASIFLGIMFIASIDPSINALIADCTEHSGCNESFSLIYMAANLGNCVAPLLAAMLFENHIDLVFFGDATATLLSGIVIWLCIKRQPLPAYHLSSAATQDETVDNGHHLFAVIKQNPFPLMFIAVFIIWPFIYSQFYFAFPLFCNEIFKQKGVLYFGYFSAANGLFVILLTPLITYISTKLTPINNIIAGGTLYAIGFGAYYFARDFKVILLFVMIWSIGEVFSNTNARAYIATIAPPAYRARFSSFLGIAFELGYGLSPAISGFIIVTTGSTRPIWGFVVANACIGIVLMRLIARRAAQAKTYISIPAQAPALK